MGFLEDVRKKAKSAEEKVKEYQVKYRDYQVSNLEKEYEDLQEKAKVAKLQKRNEKLRTSNYGNRPSVSMDTAHFDQFFGVSEKKKKYKKSVNPWDC